MVHAYILIQTEVGKAAAVAKEVSEIAGVAEAEDVTGPYDVIVRAEAKSVDELGQAGRRPHPVRRGHHAHADLPGGPPVDPTDLPPGGRSRSRPSELAHARALRRLGLVALDGQVQQTFDQFGVAEA